MKTASLIISLLTIVFVAQGQTYTARYRVWIPSDRKVIRTDKLLCPKPLLRGSIVKKDISVKTKTKTYSVSKIDTLSSDTSFLAYKSIATDVTGLSGWANLTPDETDKSIIHVNYWLNHQETIPIGSRIRLQAGDLAFDTDTAKLVISLDTSYRMKKDSAVYLSNFSKNQYDSIKTKKWFKTATTVITVFKKEDSTAIDYYLVDQFDRSGDYTITLQNREFITFTYKSWEFGPMIIPFKYRFGFTRGTAVVDPAFEADLNVGIFAGKTLWGKYRQSLEGLALKDLSKLSATWGGFLSLSTAALDSASTIAGKSPFTGTKKATIAVMSVGTAFMVTVYNFQLGLFVGIDKGVGTNARNWNFNGQPWVGLGIGYNLKSPFFK